ncbi:MAG: PQQ-binding-like beta-propeller repeat protein [Planctomycetes bacterium]|nr:PQQ-binding-like beta-propeller repeat protein [Planctomycetota bacterium]
MRRCKNTAAWSVIQALLFGVSAWTLQAGEAPKPPKPKEEAKDPPPAEGELPDPYRDLYKGYVAAFQTFLPKSGGHRNDGFGGWYKDEEEMKLSSEKHFFTLNEVVEADRANALVTEALRKEKEGKHRDALKLYQMVIDKFPEVMYRVSEQGVFVPIRRYCQRRLLDFPAGDLAYYRTLYDARAKEAYEQAKRRNSMSGMAEIVESMLATSYGDNALLELGNAALDAGNFLEALELYSLLTSSFKDSDCLTPDLQLKIGYCRKMLGDKPGTPGKATAKSELSAGELKALSDLTSKAQPLSTGAFEQRASSGSLATDDYARGKPTLDPLALQQPSWREELADSRRDQFVYTQPVVTEHSVIYRHKNMIYCRSLLNGAKRWLCDLGGRVVWQNWFERQYPMEDVLVQDGLVFTPLYKVGPSLAALDEITGQVRWTFGPMSASNEEEARMRFECAPAGGDRTVFAGYALDNIEGDTHVDTEYGMIAFESTTGRVKWRTELCRLKPPKFSAGLVQQRRNKIRSFFAPPHHSEGTVYYNTNAGALAAVDAASGQIKWLVRYPYYPGVHDAVRQFGSLSILHGGEAYVRPHDPMFWNSQRPLLMGERVFMLPIDTVFMLCLDRRTGKVEWARTKPEPGFCHLLGTTSAGELVLSTNGRNGPLSGSSGKQGAPVYLLDPATGKTTWRCEFDPILQDQQPVMAQYAYQKSVGMSINNRWFETAARPFLSDDDMLFLPTWTDCSPWWRKGCQVYHLAGISLKDKKVVHQRRYYTGQLLAEVDDIISNRAPKELEEHEKIPQKDKATLSLIEQYKKTVADSVPVNEHGPFLPFARMTFTRFGVPFELRVTPRDVMMVFDRDAVKAATAKAEGPDALFARAELAIADGLDEEAAGLLEECLAKASPNDLDFRALLDQQLYQIHRRLVQRNIFRAQPPQELQRALGMSQTAGTLAEEIETLFILAEAYERQGNLADAARCLRNLVTVYGQYEYPVSPLNAFKREETFKTGEAMLAQAETRVPAALYASEMKGGLARMSKGLPLYASAASPLPKTMTVRSGDLAVQRLLMFQRSGGRFAEEAEKAATEVLKDKSHDEQLVLLREYPGTRSAQQCLDRLFTETPKMEGEESRRRIWELADAARLCGLTIPEPFKAAVTADAGAAKPLPIATPYQAHSLNLEDAEGTAWLTLARSDPRKEHPHLMFVGGRRRQKTDNKFVLSCFDLTAGKKLWDTPNLRFLGNQVKYVGDEWGFFKAYVHKDRVVVHGLYDVFCFDVKDGKQRWRFRSPSGFEIKSSAGSGRIFVLCGQAESIALDVETTLELGEVLWQEQEAGDQYLPAYFVDDRLISVRKLPFNLTVRYRGTGKLIGSLALPDLTLFNGHPLIENGPEEVPGAIDGDRIVVTDTWYYICIDVKNLRVLWKRPIDENDQTQEPPLRFYLSGDYLAVLKKNYDMPALYMLDANSGKILWNSNPKDGNAPAPMHSIRFQNGIAYGIIPHAGQGFHFASVEAATGKRGYKIEYKDYQGKPQIDVESILPDGQAVILSQDNQDFAIRLLGLKDGKELQKVDRKGVGPMGTHGRVSAQSQAGRLILLSKDDLSF